MNSTLYITQSGTLSRKDNTLLFKNTEIKKNIPVEGIDTIYLFGEVTINTKLLNFLSQKSITLHIFNYYGFYSGSFVPRDKYVSGKLLIQQVDHYTDKQKRLKLAKKFVKGINSNIDTIIRHYAKHGTDVKRIKSSTNLHLKNLDRATDIKQILSAEGGIWESFYSLIKKILPDEFKMQTRKIRPPDNPVNALISFGNSLTYTQVLSQIYQTQLNPTIAYLHEPSEKRFSLSLDIAEIFKPDITFKILLKLLNKKMLKIRHFDKKKNYCLLNEEGRRVYIEEFDKKINSTFENQNLKRKVSFKTQMRLECYKLIKHLLKEKEYTPFNSKIKS